MAIDRFLIAPYDKQSGVQTDYLSWLIPDQAFAELDNAYVFRGRVRKRFGSRFLANDALGSRLRVNIGVTDGAGNFAGTTPLLIPTPPAVATPPLVTPAIGQLFSVDTQVFTVNQLGAPAPMLISGGAVAATFNNITGAVSITGALPLTKVYYYPALPVMGLVSYESPETNNEPVIAFDTRFAYQYLGGWERINLEAQDNAASWTGNDVKFFWGYTWSGAEPFNRLLFVTNFNESEPNFMRYYDGTQWHNFNPALGPTDFLYSARIIVPFKNRLVCFNTWEGVGSPGNNYVNRARWSQASSPLDVDAWRRDKPGKGSGLDAPTMEAIITVEFIKDRLIVFFERSTWEFVYTGNQVYPFAWQQINTELGAESTFSIVPFDKVALGIGNVGIHACNGVNVERIDSKIPDFVFDIHNDNGGIDRVSGIRDYKVEMVYWTLPNSTQDAQTPYPNKVLTYNYITGSWGLNDDSITTFGYYQPSTGITWDSETVTWDDNIGWGTGNAQAFTLWALAGNQQGYTFIIDPGVTTNASALQITDITVVGGPVLVTSTNHNLQNQSYVYVDGITGTGTMTALNGQIFQVQQATSNTFVLTSAVAAGVYSGGGELSRVSEIYLLTKQYNFYAKDGKNAYISKVDFMVDATPAGSTNINFYASTTSVNLLSDGALSGSLLGTGVLETFPYPTVTFEATAERLWHPLYLQAEGECIQLEFLMDDDQMRNVAIRSCDFQLHAMVLYAMPVSRLQ